MSDAESDVGLNATSDQSSAAEPNVGARVMTEADPNLLPAWAERLNADPQEFIPLMPAGKKPPAPVAAPTRAEPPKSGILIINKPKGQTSHDVVQAVRRAAGVRRVGHAGTLDPMATGVLVVCLESATRVIEEIQAGEKSYRARVKLGETTSSYDAEGALVASADPSRITVEQVEAELDAFRGPIDQVPPMVSALKHEGRRLYELARQGLEVERAPRRVTVYTLELEDWSPPEFTLATRVSKGFYVRSLAHDLGQRLDVGAHLTALERTAVGSFKLAEADRLARVVEAFVEGWWPALIHPLDSALLEYAAMVVDTARVAALRFGQQIEAPPPGPETTRLVRVYDATGLFVGLVRFDDVTRMWQPDRIFTATTQRSQAGADASEGADGS